MSTSIEATDRPLQAEDFEPLVGRRVAIGETGLALKLDAVERWPVSPADVRLRAPFILILSRSRGGTYLRDGLYRCDFGGGLVEEVHIAAIPTEAVDRQDYQAPFN